MKQRTQTAPALILILLLALAGTALPAAAAGSADTGEPPPAAFSDLDQFSQLQQAFEQDRGSVRIVTLLSASCGYCIKGYRYVRKILDEVSDPRLKVLVAWEPMLSGDTRELSYKMSKKADDPRFVYQAWDESRVSGKAWTSVMLDGDDRWHATGPAWDVYFIYDGDAEWSQDRPAVPAYWQHQGAGDRELVLDYDKLKSAVEAALDRLDENLDTATTAP